MYLFLLITFITWTSSVVKGEGAVPIVSTEGGKISGVLRESINGRSIYSYHSIPFGKPPVGDLRFKDPVKAEPWQGVRDGSSLPEPCLHVPYAAFLLGIKIPAEALPGSEDCLHLNVYTPKVSNENTKYEDLLPVMVYIHGGGFFAGGSEENLPDVLLSKDVILVTIQYRLGIIGFLSTEDSVIPGNFGLKDQNLALQWVQKNIKAFGGDPERVTIFGESAGAASVHYHILSPKAAGLFSGAIMQSGNALCPWALTALHKENAEDVGSKVGCDLQKGSQQYLTCMQSISGAEIAGVLQDLAKWFACPLVNVPRVDGDYVPDHPAKLMKEGRYNKVNIISGITSHEGAELALPIYAAGIFEPLKTEFATNGPLSLQWHSADKHPMELAHKVYNYHAGGVNVEPDYADDLVEMFGNAHFNVPHDWVTEIYAQNSEVSTFRYELVHRGELSLTDFVNVSLGHHWVSHTDDLYYLFSGGPLFQPSFSPPERAKDIGRPQDLMVRHIFVSAWTNFATYGDPTPDDSAGFHWDATTSNNLRHLTISPKPSMTRDARKKTRQFYNSLPILVNRYLHPDEIEEIDVNSASEPRKIDEL